jgi:2-methylcitrate dehydratase PrpD
VHDPELEKVFPIQWPASVAIVTNAGEVLRTRIDYPKGDPENPLTWEELIAKFQDLTAPVFDESVKGRIVDLVRSLEGEGDLDRLTELLLMKE